MILLAHSINPASIIAPRTRPMNGRTSHTDGSSRARISSNRMASIGDEFTTTEEYENGSVQ